MDQWEHGYEGPWPMEKCQQVAARTKGRVQKTKWKFAIKRRTPPPRPLMALISIHFLPQFFSFAIESYLYETDFTLGVIQKYNFQVLL